MVMGRSYRAGRHMGRIGQDSSMRMTNRAEVGFGMTSLLVIGVFILLIIGVFL